MCKANMFDAANDEADCKCKQAVERAYHTLVGTGHPVSMALDAAKRVYRHHHPEDSREESGLMVERWVSQLH